MTTRQDEQTRLTWTRREILRTGLALLASGAFGMALPLVAEAEPKPGEGFRWEGEELYYSVEVSGAEAARASLRAGTLQKVKGASYIPLSAKAITHGFFAKSYPVDDNADTFIHPKTLRPLKADKIIREDGQERVYEVRYDSGSFTADVVRKGEKGEYKYKRSVPAETHDAISWLYELRTKPLKDGDTYTFYVYDGWKLSRLHIKVVGREPAWTALQTFNAVKIEIKREVLNSRWNGTPKKRLAPQLTTRQAPYFMGTLHLSDDEARIPVRVFVASSSGIGDSDFKLIKYVAPPKKK